MRTLARFIHGFDFIRMKPDRSIVKGGLPEKTKAYALVETGKQYAVYLFGGPQANLEVELPAGNYQAEWLDPVTGKVGPKTRLKHAGGSALLKSPSYEPDVVLRIVPPEAAGRNVHYHHA